MKFILTQILEEDCLKTKFPPGADQKIKQALELQKTCPSEWNCSKLEPTNRTTHPEGVVQYGKDKN